MLQFLIFLVLLFVVIGGGGRALTAASINKSTAGAWLISILKTSRVVKLEFQGEISRAGDKVLRSVLSDGNGQKIAAREPLEL